MQDKIDTTNDYGVGVSSNPTEVILLIAAYGRIPKDKALRLAAYIVAMADPDEEEFVSILEAIQNT